MLGPDGQPLARKYYVEKTERDLDADEMVRGYEIKPGKYVPISDEELDRLAPEKTRDIDIKIFVPEKSIPPVLFDRGYFLTPAANSEKAYKLLAETLEKSGRAGIATFVMRGKEYLVAMFSEHDILRAETMRFPDEVRTPKEIGLPKKPKVSRATVKKFEKLISGKSKKQLSTTKLKDEPTERLLKLVKKKSAQRKNVVEVENEQDRSDGNVIDLVAVLKKSLAGKGR
jgi:DNA end-binding protein Ku